MVGNFKEYCGISDLIRNWKSDPQNLKKAFMELRDIIASKENTFITFKSRPGVSHSLRSNVITGDKESRIFALVDVIDDDPENRWLSVCFYNGTITEDKEPGNIIPDGILGEDGYCFDLDANEEYMISYLKDKYRRGLCENS